MSPHAWRLLISIPFLLLCGSLGSGDGKNAWYPHTKVEEKLNHPRLISLQIPLVLYDEVFHQFKVFPNGAISFEERPQFAKRTFSLKKRKLIAPFLLLAPRQKRFQQFTVDLLYDVKVLQKASNDVHYFFNFHRDFEAFQVVVISWTHHLRLIHQTILISNGKQTFLQLIYRGSKKMMHKKAHAGLSNGDGVRYTYLINPKSRDNRDLLKNSNVGKAGRWAFYIGSTEGSVFQIHPATTTPFTNNKSKGKLDPGVGCFKLKTSSSPFKIFSKETLPECLDLCRSLGQPMAIVKAQRSCSCISKLHKIFAGVPEQSCRSNEHFRLYSTTQLLSDEQSVSDVNECNTPNICSPNADCINSRFAYQCICKTGYFGNGKVCISSSSSARIFGKVSGDLNGRQIADADLSGIILVDRGVTLLTISSIDENIGLALQLGSAATDIIGWIFAAKIENFLKNGLEIVGDRFKSKIVLKFSTGEEFTATHEMKGQDDFNYFVIDTKVSGQLPAVKTYVRPVLDDYWIQLQEREYGTIEGKTSVTYSLEDERDSYSMSVSIVYDAQTKRTLDSRQVFSMVRRTAFYDSRQMLIRFQQQAITQYSEGITPPVPKSTVSTSDRFQTLSSSTMKTSQAVLSTMTLTKVPTTASSTATETPSTTEVPTTTSSPTTKGTTTVQTQAPTTVTKCGDDVCHSNAQCQNFGGVSQCVCEKDYTGNGTHCQVDNRLKCGPNRCSEHSECVEENQRLFCVCKSGYSGDGVTCEDEKQCNCHPDATCYSNGQGLKYCLCDYGFKGDGKTCEDVNECQRNAITCGPNSKCINTRGSYMCECLKGYRKSKTSCEDIPECTEQKYVCHETAKCIELPGSYECKCPEGFRFNVDGRSCVVECSRCLNGGKCIGTDKCLCHSGFTGQRCQWAGNEFLALGIGGTIKRISMPVTTYGRGSIFEQRGHLFVAVDYDCQDNMVYWTDLVQGTISRASYNGTNAEVIVRGLADPQGITIDWLGRNIFWTDTGSDRIGVSSLNGFHRKDSLISGELRNPRAIVCDPYRGKLYWTDWNRNRPRIEVASMDGSSRRVLVSSNLLLPNGLAIDRRQEKLCWTDAWYSSISCTGFDGTQREILLSTAKYPFGIAIRDSMIYWTEWKTNKIARYDRDTKNSLPSIRGSIGSDGRLYDIKVVSPCAERKNACSSAKNTCPYLCLMKDKYSSTCVCPAAPSFLLPEGVCNRTV